MKNNKPKTIEEFEQAFDERFVNAVEVIDGREHTITRNSTSVGDIKQFFRTYLESVLEYLEMGDFDDEQQDFKKLAVSGYNSAVKALNQKIEGIRGEGIEE